MNRVTRNTSGVKFIADVMLGRLAKRLRLLGFDVLYRHDQDDNEIAMTSLAEQRVILTRDRAFAARPVAAHHLVIESDQVADQVKQVLARYPVDSPSFSRCSVCNAMLIPLSDGDVVGRAPPYVLATHDSFLGCPTCGRIYWAGTHLERMKEWMQKL